MMFKSLLVVSALALGASAQSPSGAAEDSSSGLGGIPTECFGKCLDLRPLLSKCSGFDKACWQSMCEMQTQARTCLECAKKTDLLNKLTSACEKTTNVTMSASGSGSPSASGSGGAGVQSTKGSGAGMLAASVGAVAAGAAVAAWF